VRNIPAPRFPVTSGRFSCGNRWQDRQTQHQRI